MSAAPSFSTFRPPPPTVAPRTARGVTEFLGAHDKLGALLPAAARMAQLQKDCARHLPPMFDACEVLQFAAEQLVLTVPNAALAAKLKQQLPKLQEVLCRQGWQVNAVRLKVQAGRPVETPPFSAHWNWRPAHCQRWLRLTPSWATRRAMRS